MGIAFLFPLALIGTLAVAVPVWLHLNRRFRGSVVRFPALRFLHDEPLARRAPLRLQHPLLFAIRALAVALLAAAFAWPYDPARVEQPSLESRVYLLDNTLSHQAEGAFIAHRDRLADELASSDPRTQSAVIELASQPRIVVPFGQDRTAAADTVRSLEPTFERGSYAAAFRLADTLIRSSIGDQRRLIIYSDHQSNQHEELGELPAFFDHCAIERATAVPETKRNLALARPQVRRMLAGDRSLIELAVELFHQGGIEQAAVAVVANGNQVFNRSIELADQPARTLLTTRWSEPRGIAIRGEVVISGESDSLAGDDRVYFALPAVAPGKVSLIARSVFLRAAFAPDVMHEAWRVEVAEPAEAVAAATHHGLADLLCIESRYFRDSSAAKTLVQQYLDAERGVLLIVNESGPEVAQALGELGFEMDDVLVDVGSLPAGYVQRDHMIFQPFRSADFGSLTDVRFFRHYAVRGRNATALLFDAGGSPLLFDAGGNRKLLVAAFPFERVATDWPVQTTFVPFLDQCLQFLHTRPAVPTSLLPRELAVFHLPAGSAAREFVVLDGDRELARGSIQNRRVQVAAPPTPGTYTLQFNAQAEPPIWLAVNTPPAESELTYSDPTEIYKQILQPEQIVESSPQPDAAPIDRSEILRQRLWWFVILLALLFFFSENILLAVRQSASPALRAEIRRLFLRRTDRPIGSKGA